ncbi:MAG: 50S ribosomal protein L6 [Candidatus Aenigmarchaeota archaeon ex4484_224]|nr:MAG: 50S ribosomal protein L6 [Candidatus Aenigmarchaeota archaeon ex4484_224]
MAEKFVEIPENVEIEIDGYKVKVKGPKGEIEREFKVWRKDVFLEKKDNKVRVWSESDKRKTKAMVGTIAAHIRNMINGVTKGFVYKLKIVYSHFPVNVKVEGDKVVIQNFLGEKVPRIAQIVGKNTRVEVKGEDVIVKGIDIEEVGTTASNIEQACRIVGKDRRRFIDGIYIYERGFEENG